MSRIDTVGVFGVYDGDWKAAKVTSDGKLETVSTIAAGTGIATEQKQDDQILELQTMVTSLNSIDTEVTANGVTLSDISSEIGTQSGTLTSISDNTAATATDVANIDGKITAGDDDSLVTALQTVIYGRKDAAPSGLRAVEVKNDGQLITSDEHITIGNSPVAAPGVLQQVLIYGKDNQGNLDPIDVDTQGHLKVTVQDEEKSVLTTPYTSFMNAVTLTAGSQFATEIDMTDKKHLQIVGTCTEATAQLGLAYYDGVGAWRTDGVEANIFDDGTTKQFSLTIRDLGATSVKVMNLGTSSITNLSVTHYRY